MLAPRKDSEDGVCWAAAAHVSCGGTREATKQSPIIISNESRHAPKGRAFVGYVARSGRGGRGSNHRDQSESAPILGRPRGRAIARTEMPSSGVETAGKPLGLAEAGSWGVGATTGWRRHFDWGWTAEPVHVEPLLTFVKK